MVYTGMVPGVDDIDLPESLRDAYGGENNENAGSSKQERREKKYLPPTGMSKTSISFPHSVAVCVCVCVCVYVCCTSVCFPLQIWPLHACLVVVARSACTDHTCRLLHCNALQLANVD